MNVQDKKNRNPSTKIATCIQKFDLKNLPKIRKIATKLYGNLPEGCDDFSGFICKLEPLRFIQGQKEAKDDRYKASGCLTLEK
jgi:hypothetical protein